MDVLRCPHIYQQQCQTLQSLLREMYGDQLTINPVYGISFTEA